MTDIEIYDIEGWRAQALNMYPERAEKINQIADDAWIDRCDRVILIDASKDHFH